MNHVKIIFGNMNSIHLERWCSYFFSDNSYFFISYEKVTDKSYPRLLGNMRRNKLFFSIFFFFNFFKILKIIINLKPKVILIHYINEISIILFILKFFFKFKIIMIPWGSDVNLNKNTLSSYVKSKLFNLSDLIITDGFHIKNYLINRFKVNENKILIFNFPIKFNTLKEMLISNNKNIKNIIFSNRSLDNIYSIDILIKAFEIFYKKNKNYILYLVGDGDEKNNLKKLVASLNLSDQIIFFGRLEYSKMLNLLIESEIFVSSSKSDAGLSSSIAEAIYLKKPVVVSDNSDNNIWIKDFDNGLLFKTDDVQALADKLNYMSNNKLTYSQNTYNYFLDNFSYESIMPKVKDIIDKLSSMSIVK
jgi:glycosyltransferase involved in cell wall biosynthesis